jgi:hypothetical protein
LDYVEEYHHHPLPSSSLTLWNSDNDSDWQYALYLDVDIVVAQPLHPFLERLLVLSSKTARQEHVDDIDNHNHNHNNNNSISTLAMFPDCATCAKKVLNSGILWMHRQKSQFCVSRWRHFFDTSPHTLRDQSLLRKLKKFAPNCHLHHLSPSTECLYPNWREMRLLQNENKATFVHNTNTYGSIKIPNHVQERYFAHLLNTTQF